MIKLLKHLAVMGKNGHIRGLVGYKPITRNGSNFSHRESGDYISLSKSPSPVFSTQSYSLAHLRIGIIIR